MWPKTPETQVLTHLHRRGPLTRSELHELTGVRANTIGKVANDLLRKGLIRQGESEVLGPGRPRVPLRIDDAPWRVIGLGLEPHRASVCRLTPRGALAGRVIARAADGPEDLIHKAAALLRQACEGHMLVVGVSVPGFADPQRHTLLLSSAAPGESSVDLEPLFDAIGSRPLVLENDMHAAAARWSLAQHPDPTEDILLVSLRDGAIGSALLIDGKPNRGCVVGGNELGHMRFAVETDRCHCGRHGCLARIFSTAFLHRHGASSAVTLDQKVAGYDGKDPALRAMLDHLATGLANAVNFVRPSRVVLISELTRHAMFNRALRESVRSNLLPDIAARVQFSSWDQPVASAAENAGWLALAAVYSEEWRRGTGVPAASA